MKRTVLLLLCVVVSWAAEDLQLAEQCNEELCKLPECRCSSSGIPGGLSARDTPQFVTVTFDDPAYFLTMETYRSILYGRRNSNGCRAGITFFQTHEFTDYQAINELYNQGFEIALESMAHRQTQEYWQQASYDELVEQFADQRKQMAHFANIPIDEIKGIRIPNFHSTGNNSYLVIKNNGLVYDNSWATNDPDSRLWPYTLDYASTQDCPQGPCPSASLPGVWVAPVTPWRDQSGKPCILMQQCEDSPDFYDAEAWYQFILSNFERHYMNSRTPFGVYARESHLITYPSIMRAVSRFLDLVNNMEDAFVVNTSDVIDWVKDPVPVSEYKKKACRSVPDAPCQTNNCEPPPPSFEEMYVCSNECPRVFPGLGNPFGQ